MRLETETVTATLWRKNKMDIDSESTATSVDENTENFCENPTRDTLAEGLMGLIKPTVDQLDERVRATRLENCIHIQVYDIFTPFLLEFPNWN